MDTNLFAEGSTIYMTTFGNIAIVYGTLITKSTIIGSYTAFNTVAKGITPNSQSFALNGIVENSEAHVYFPVNENKLFSINVSNGTIPAGVYIRVFGSFIFK